MINIEFCTFNKHLITNKWNKKNKIYLGMTKKYVSYLDLLVFLYYSKWLEILYAIKIHQIFVECFTQKQNQ